jgi:hypothetical protein
MCITLDTPTERALKMVENPEEIKKGVAELIELAKPEAMYFSTIRRRALFVVNAEDPHVELRNVFEALSRFGEVTIDPVSSLDEFGRFMAQL